MHTIFSHTFTHSLSPPPLSFLPSPTPLQPLKLIIGRSRLVGLSDPLIFSALAPTPGFGAGFGCFFPFLALSIFLSKFLFKKLQDHTFFPALAPKINLVL